MAEVLARKVISRTLCRKEKRKGNAAPPNCVRGLNELGCAWAPAHEITRGRILEGSPPADMPFSPIRKFRGLLPLLRETSAQSERP